MKKQVIILLILCSILGCQPKSDCFGGRIIIDEVETIVKYEKWKDALFKEKKGIKYIACNFPDTLVKNQNYNVVLKLLKTEPTEQLIGLPCEIKALEVQKNQKFRSLEVNQRTLFVGGGGQTDKGETITVGIYITKISETEIEYEFTELLNWKNKREIKGKALLQSSLDDTIQTKNQEFESAYRFIDSKNNISIFVTKEFQINHTKSRIFEKGKSKYSGLMFNK
jgi:hypothetical protein